MIREEKWPKVAIIVLNWNGWPDTLECLESLYQITYQNFEVIVVDNGSRDESVNKIRDYCEGKLRIKSDFFKYDHINKPIKIIEYSKSDAERRDIPEASNRKLILIKNEKNYGFAEGNNIGFEIALKRGAKYLLALNNDTVVSRDFLNILISAMENNDKIGIAGPTCYYYAEPSTIWSAGIKINWWTGSINHAISKEIIKVDSVSGCAMIIKNKVINNISSFDKRFPFGQEDYEFCTRAIRNDFKVIYVPNSKVWHKISRSRKYLMNDMSERKALLGNTGDLKLKDKLLLFKICSPTKIHFISEIIFFFGTLIISLPMKGFKYYKKYGFKSSLLKTKSTIAELIKLF